MDGNVMNEFTRRYSVEADFTWETIEKIKYKTELHIC